MKRIMLALWVTVAVLASGGYAADEKASVPKDNPAAAYKLAWTEEIKWGNVVSIADMKGSSVDERFAAAQETLGKEGGVVYFPAGTYALKDSLKLKTGVVIRGADPQGVKDAKDEKYDPPTKLEFPRYVPSFEGDGTPIESAFKGIGLSDPANAVNCGVVNVAINHGHVEFEEDKDHNAGKNRIVYGCLVRNAAILEPTVPVSFQNKWQRFTHRHHAALHVKSAENLLVGNNRLPESDGNFVMKNYKLNPKQGDKNVVEKDVTFDYDFRPGIYANLASPGQSFGGKQFTPEERPWAFRKGIVIRDNYVFCTGSPGILFTGDGTICSFNIIRFKKNVQRETVGGTYSGHFTCNIRAIEMRGWRWTVEGNDFEVHRNLGRIGPDGEGLMHEAHENCTIKDSKLINNKGNSYICIWRTGVDGLLIKGNQITSNSKWGAICVLSVTTKGQSFPCKNVTITDNVTAKAGISITGTGQNNLIENNKHEGDGGKIQNYAKAVVRNNQGYGAEEPKKDATGPKKDAEEPATNE